MVPCYHLHFHIHTHIHILPSFDIMIACFVAHCLNFQLAVLVLTALWFHWDLQAFVADTAVEAMGVAVVMSEQEEEELDDRKRRQLLCRIGAVICTIAIAVIVVLVVVFTGGDSSGGSSSVAEVPSNSPTDTPTGSPTSMLFAETLEVFKAAYANDDMYNAAFSSKDTPQFKAAEWATGEGSAGLSSTDPRMLARYALATLYFSTQGDEWTTCGRDATKCARTEWLTNDNECDWFAIQCDDGVINNLFFRK